MPQSHAQLVVALLVVSSLIGGAVTLSEPVRGQTQPDVDTTILRIELHENASATWELQIRTRLRTSDDEAEYRAFQRQFENNTSAFLAPFAERINGTVSAANRATGREMNATGFEASTRLQSVPRQWGVVTYRFRWTNFAVERDAQLVVGDVFESGLFIAENDSLEVVAPPGYQTVSATPRAVERDDGVLTWNGPESFADGEPRVAFEPKPTEEPSVETTVSQDGTGGLSIGGPLGAVFLLAFVAAGVWWQRSNGDAGDSWSFGGRNSGDGDDGGAEVTVDGDDAEVTVSPPESSHQHDGGGDGDTAPDSDTGPDSDEDDDTDHAQNETSTVGVGGIVTDEDRVRTLLRESGGRIRQKDVVTELGWSKSKVSRILSRMEDDGTVEKLRLGRENVIELVADADADEPDTGE